MKDVTPQQEVPRVDVAVIGAGAAGLMAALWAGRTLRELGISPRVVALDGARTLGAKILVAGGGRCNVTHHEVDESAYAGSSRHAIKKVLRAFDVPTTVEFFRELGVELKQEDTGKLFPVTDSARTVLTALLRGVGDAGAQVWNPWRVDRITALAPEGPGDAPEGFEITAAPAAAAPETASQTQGLASPVVHARRVILCTGGMSLPKSGSDGHGYALVKALGHSVTPLVFPALVPLLLPQDHFVLELSGIACEATLELRSPTGKRLVSFTNSTLCTHFGLSGPGPLDISRFVLDALGPEPINPADRSRGGLFINWMPRETTESLDRRLLDGGKRPVASVLRDALPERLALALCAQTGVDPRLHCSALTREPRRSLARLTTDMPIPLRGSRGFNYAEVTAGGVPLAEVRLETMESRLCPGLHLAGEICDVDGRIGGFNFQWAWASGFVAGCAAAKACLVER